MFLGFCQGALGQTPEIDSLKQLLSTEQVNYNNAIHTVTANLGEINLLMENYEAALHFQLETIYLLEKDGDLSNLTENYGHVSIIYEKLGNYKDALAFQKKARIMRDSTAKKESDIAMSEMLTRYESGKKEATIAAQEKQLSQQRLVQWLIIGIAILLSGFLLFGLQSYKTRTKANRLLAAKKAENELLTNTLKYAFPEGQQGKVEISLQKNADGVLQLKVSDNGVGKSGLTKGTGFGSQLISLLTQQLNGIMREEVKDGTRVSFVFKPAKAA